ncbi:hypothetical protein CERZMDRAFT_99894 [Cercospora zeae-maydis SCOH1-5]|uniref:Uncharacterized protein n=1 Tax=Cercospora zeae-maydis SCOH1-5 TaxID=717836 RepID=A0A6A6F8X5_9PEZI|nr:hypothetical protein CERZMDRAFT_99894 [Cercospora zeae-maydis SCOH1-5]
MASHSLQFPELDGGDHSTVTAVLLDHSSPHFRLFSHNTFIERHCGNRRRAWKPTALGVRYATDKGIVVDVLDED